MSKPTTHKVVSGDTLSALAKRYGTTVKELKDINGLKSDLIKVGQTLKLVRNSKPANSTTTGPILKTKYLCDALKELAVYEIQKGTDKFCDFVYKFPSTIQHHSVIGNDKNADDITEFKTHIYPQMDYGWYGIELGIEIKPPVLPIYIDIEWVEIGYVLYRKYYGGSFAFYIGWNTFKLIMQKVFGHGGTNFGHPPNKYGFLLGVYIAKEYKTIQGFSNSWCVARNGW